MDDVPDFANLSPLDKYDIAVRRIAANAPIRICPHEMLSGAATLSFAIQHTVPATYDGKRVFETFPISWWIL